MNATKKTSAMTGQFDGIALLPPSPGTFAEPHAGRVRRALEKLWLLGPHLATLAEKLSRPELGALVDLIDMAAERALQGGPDAYSDLRAAHRFLEGRRREVVEARQHLPAIDARRFAVVRLSKAKKGRAA